MSTIDQAWEKYRAEWDFADTDPSPLRVAFMAGYRRALEDAADALEAPTGSVCDWGHKTEDDCKDFCAQPDNLTRLASADWLRDRAAGVGTKDGDDDRPHVHQWIQAQTEWGTPYKYCSCGERYLL